MLEPWVFGNAWMPDTQEIGGGSRVQEATEHGESSDICSGTQHKSQEKRRLGQCGLFGFETHGFMRSGMICTSFTRDLLFKGMLCPKRKSGPPL